MPLFHWVGFVFTAWIAADFITGLIHWWEDRYSNPKWPILGPLVAEPNELHHTQPAAFLAGSYLWRNSTALVPALIVAICCGIIGQWWWALTAFFCSQANEVHCWAHRGGTPAIIRRVQETGLFQGPRHHAKHHTEPHDSHFCVMTNFLNPLLDGIGFWRFLEKTVYFVFLAKTKAN